MPETDERLAALIGRGEEALAEILELETPRLRRIVTLRMDPKLSGRIDPGDILQETWLEARRRLPRYLENPAAPVFVWLRGLAIELLIEAHRYHVGTKKRDVGHEVSIESIGSHASSVAVLARYLIDRDGTPGGRLHQVERSRLIESALAELDETDREVLTLRHFEQLGNDEVARILGVKKSAASRRYTRALLHLRELLQSVPGLDL